MIKSKSLLIIGYVWPEPKSSAAGNRMLQLIDLFITEKYAITFATTAQNLEFSENLTLKGIAIKTIELNSTSFDEFIKELNPDIVLFDRFMIEEQFGWRVSESCPEALKILNTEDLHSLRHTRQIALKENRSFDLQDLANSDIAKREIASIYRCDLSLFVSEFEIATLKNYFSISSDLLHYLPIFTEPSKDILPNFNQRTDFIFIGNFLHEPNWDAVRYLSEKIWPIIHEKLPDAKMKIYGAYPTQKVLQLHNKKNNFYVMGRAENAINVVKHAKVVIASIRFGAGIKGKLLEAMQCGTPSITTSVGAEAMFGDLNWNGYIEDNPEEFALKAFELYTQELLWKTSQENGYKILEQRNNIINFGTEFITRIEDLKLNLKLYRSKNFIGSMLLHHSNMSTKYLSKWIEEKNKK